MTEEGWAMRGNCPVRSPVGGGALMFPPFAGASSAWTSIETVIGDLIRGLEPSYPLASNRGWNHKIRRQVEIPQHPRRQRDEIRPVPNLCPMPVHQTRGIN